MTNYQRASVERSGQELKIRAWDHERKQWEPCTSLDYDFIKKAWRHIRKWSDGDEDWLYGVEVFISGTWHKID